MLYCVLYINKVQEYHSHMAVLSLKVRIAEQGMVKTMQFDPSTVVYDACRIIREKMPEANLGQPKDYGLFLADDDPKKGVWMENGRPLEYYLVRTGDLLEYKRKTRKLIVRMLDGSVKTLLVDDSQPVGQLMVVICTRIGITNHDEYSLVRDLPVEPDRTGSLKKEEKMGTLTLGRSKEKKMEILRKQLHTDEELNWLDHGKTLREQGVDENETILLRRKYFFSDQNIDSRDPVQLNLLYVQCRDGVIDGTHPVSLEEAFQLAGLQCQIQYGDFIETKHRSGYLELKEFLPKEYMKVKGAEKRILQEHRNRKGWNELDAKVEYTGKCRSLKTYGVTFFLVKEKMKGKNKLVPRLLGVNKDCVMRVDERTKEVLKVWPLEQVRRWAASPNTFTLDFGDYQDSYYSVQTNDGEKIAQLIAGYIDIILKRKKAKDHFGIEGDEGSTMLEDTVSPAKATLMSTGTISEKQVEESNVALPGIIRVGINGEQQFGSGTMQQAQYGGIVGRVSEGHLPVTGQQPKVIDQLSKSQRALVGTIQTSIKTVEKAEEDLKTKAPLPPLGDDAASKKWKETEMDVNRSKVQDQLAAIAASTAEVVQKTSAVPDRVDHTAVGAAISTISSNIPDMTKGVRTIAALMEEEDKGDRLLEATRKLCGAFSELLVSVNPETTERSLKAGAQEPVKVLPPTPAPRMRVSEEFDETNKPRQKMLAAAGRVGDYSHAMIHTMQEPSDSEKEFQDLLVYLAKGVATTTAQLVLKAKTVSSKCEDQALQDKVIHSATQCAFATSQLVACARVVAPTIDSPACQEQLTEAAKQVAKAVEQLLKDAELASKDERSLGDLRDAAAQVTKALNDMLGHIKTGPKKAEMSDAEAILQYTERISTYSESQKDIIANARMVAQATGSLISHIKGEAQIQEDTDHHQRLMGAAKKLADATTKMIEAAKSCASSPMDFDNQMHLKSAAEEVRVATSAAGQDQLRRAAILKLEQAVKHTVASATQSVAAAAVCEQSNRNPLSQQDMTNNCQDVADLTPRVIAGVKHSQSRVDDISAQLELLRLSQEFLQPCDSLVRSSRAAGPTIGDSSASMQLSNSTRSLSHSLVELRMAISRAQDVLGNLDIENAIQVIRQLDGELYDMRKSLAEGHVYPLPGETVEQSISQVHASTKSVSSSISQILSAAAQGDENYAGFAARDTAEGLKGLTHGVHGVVSTGQNISKEKLIDNSRDVMEKSQQLMVELRSCLRNPGQEEYQHRLNHVAKSVTFNLNNCVSCLPGQQDIDTAINTVSMIMQTLNSNQLPSTSRSYGEVQEDLLRTANELTNATNRVVSALNESPQRLSEAVALFIQIFKRFITIGLELAYLTQDTVIREQIVEALRSCAQQAARLLLQAKSAAVDPQAPNSRLQLATAARAVTESINRLIDICTAGAPWQKECDNALRNIQSCRHLLESPSAPINEYSYFECLDVVTDKSKSLGDGMTGIAHHAKNSEFDSFCRSVREVSDAVCGLAESAGQSAYLVGVSDRNSVAGRLGLIDGNRFGRSVEAVREACETLRSTRVTPHQVLEAATTIAKHTSILANMCRDASAKTNNPAAKKHFINCAREIASSTANLIKYIKTLDTDFSDANKRDCAESTGPLLTALDTLSTFVSSPEFASIPAKISPQGRLAQQPITTSGMRMLDGSCEMILTAKSLALNPKDPPSWQNLATHSKSVSDSIKSLVSAIRDGAPGQTECDWAIEHLNELIRNLERNSISAINQSMPQRTDASEQQFHERTCNSAQQIYERIEGVRSAGLREAENLGHRVVEIMSYFEPLTDSCAGAASLSYNSRRQMALLDQCKTVCESQLQFMYACKDSAGNPRATQFHDELNSQAANLQQALNELMQTISDAVSEAGVVSSMVDTISRAIARADESVTVEGSFVDFQTRMVRACKEIIRISQEMVSKAYTNPGDLGPLALELSRNYAQLAEDSRGAVAATAGTEVAHRIRATVQELGTACIELVKNAGTVRGNPSDSFAKNDLNESSRVVADRVAAVLAALQSGGRGTQACINAASTVSGIIGDLDTTIMFATAGTLNPEREGDVFSDHREAILKTAKALVEDTKALVSGAASSQEQLAVAAQNTVRTIINLSDVVKAGAAALTSQNSQAQVLVINAVKRVAAALASLIQATKNASGKSYDDPTMTHLKDAAKEMVTTVTSLLKTVKSVEDENQQGTRALENAIEGIAQEIRAYDSKEPPSGSANPSDLIRASMPITDATAKVVAASNSCQQIDISNAATGAATVVSNLLFVSKAIAYSAETADAKFKALDAGRDVAIRVRELLQILHLVLQKPTTENRQHMVPASRNIALAVSELVGFAELLRGSDWIDPSDPSFIAENELLSAANSIEAAARKLGQLKPRPEARQADETLNFDGQILDAAKSIANAVSALVKAATAAQRELVAQGRIDPKPKLQTEDYQWSEGLISAARLVAAATHKLCEEGSALVQGLGNEERLIGAAKQVAAGTAQLLIACRVKSDMGSKSMQRLQVAGNAVNQATEHLVKAAKGAFGSMEEEKTVVINQKMVSGIAQVMDAQEEVLRKERELEEARVKLSAIRRAKYAKEGPHEDSPEAKYYSDF